MIDNNLKYLARYVTQHVKSLIIVLVALLSVAASLLAIGFVFRKLVDYGFGGDQISEIHASVYLISLLIGIFSIGSFFRSYFINVIAVKVISELKSATYSNLLKAGLIQFEDLKIGDILSMQGLDED